MKTTPKVLILILLATCCSVFAADPKEVAATNFAKSWLQLVDDGKYDQCWKEMSASFQSTVRKDKWQSEVGHSRKMLGKVRSRKLLNAVYTTKLSGADDGEYVVVTFFSSFEKLGSGIETVVPQLEPDGTWKISGYGVKPSDVNDSDFPASPR